MKGKLENKIMIVIALFLGSCTSNSPESIGEKWAEKSCDCFKIGKQAQIDIAQQLKKLAKEGTYKTLDEIRKANQEMLSKVDYNVANEKAKKCYKELKELEQQIKIDFAKEDDRQTIKNKFNALTEVCEKDINHQMYIDDDEMRSILNLPSEDEERKAMIEKASKEMEQAVKQASEAAKKAMGK